MSNWVEDLGDLGELLQPRESNEYKPESPVHTPSSHGCEQPLREYNPESPVHTPSSHGYDPTSPAYNSTSPAYNPTSPAYNPTSPSTWRIFDTGYNGLSSSQYEHDDPNRKPFTFQNPYDHSKCIQDLQEIHNRKRALPGALWFLQSDQEAAEMEQLFEDENKSRIEEANNTVPYSVKIIETQYGDDNVVKRCSKNNQPISHTSGYAPAICNGCNKRGLHRAIKILMLGWRSIYTRDRKDYIDRIMSAVSSNDIESVIRETTLHPMDAQSANFDTMGIPPSLWKEAGIESDCCKAEILTYIPLDEWLWYYKSADTSQPCDFSMHGIVEWSRLNDNQTMDDFPSSHFPLIATSSHTAT